MQQIVTPVMPFPNMFWWSVLQGGEEVLFDVAEHFVKMSYRNRYYITGANGLIQLTVPLAHGRDQRTAMKNVLIDNNERWQVNHWRTITSVYGRAPYFEHYGPLLEPLFSQKFDTLVAFNRATIAWLQLQTGIKFSPTEVEVYKKYDDDVTDLRGKQFMPGIEKNPLAENYGLYYQLFSERNGFYPNLCLLDLLFSEGPAVRQVLKQHKAVIAAWHK